MTWTAVCLSNGKFNTSGFQTENDAIQYVLDNHLCSMCVEEGWSSSCAAEWLAVETEKLEQCETLGDVFTAAGMIEVEK